MNKNILLNTDVYKVNHAVFYPEGTTKVYSYLLARSDKVLDKTLFFGLQYYIKEYLSKPVTKENVDEFIEIMEGILGKDSIDRTRYDQLATLGYLPIEIKAVKEGTILPTKNVLLTITNTHPDFYWLVGFLESILLKVWNTTTIASNSFQLSKVCEDFMERTCDNKTLLPFQIHDFGYRGCSSEETAALSGAAHLISFLGTDTVPAVKFVKQYYGVRSGEPIGLSVPATEHSVMCAYGKEKEVDAFRTMLKKYPTGLVSIVSDTWNIWNVLTNVAMELKDDILARDGKLVFRLDSGNPLEGLCGCPTAKVGSNERLGALELLWKGFGGTYNSKGYKVLNPKVGLIYGDGIYPERMTKIFEVMTEMGFATSNIVFGIGGLLLQNFSRDTMGFTMKATYATVNGEHRNLLKDPITDPKKKSHTGYIALRKTSTGEFVTIDGLTETESQDTLLETVFKDGWFKETTFSSVRETALEFRSV